MTSHLWITLDANNTMQNVQSFNQTNWIWEPLSSETNEKLLKALSSPGERFRKSRDAVLESCINLVVKQHKRKSNDFIDEMIKRTETADLEKFVLNVDVNLMEAIVYAATVEVVL